MEPTLRLSPKPSSSSSPDISPSDSTAHPVPTHPHVLLVLVPLGSLGDPVARERAVQIRRRERPALFRLLQDRDPRFTRPSPSSEDRSNARIQRNGPGRSLEIPFLLPGTTPDTDCEKSRSHYWSFDEGGAKASEMTLEPPLSFQEDMDPCSLLGSLEGMESLPSVFSMPHDHDISNAFSRESMPELDLASDGMLDPPDSVQSPEEPKGSATAKELQSTPISNEPADASHQLAEVPSKALAEPQSLVETEMAFASTKTEPSNQTSPNTATGTRRSKRVRKYSSEQTQTGAILVPPPSTATAASSPEMTSAGAEPSIPVSPMSSIPIAVSPTSAATASVSVSSATNAGTSAGPAEKRIRTRKSLAVDKAVAQAAAVLPWEVHSVGTIPSTCTQSAPQTSQQHTIATSPTLQAAQEPALAGPVTRKRKLSHVFAAVTGEETVAVNQLSPTVTAAAHPTANTGASPPRTAAHASNAPATRKSTRSSAAHTAVTTTPSMSVAASAFDVTDHPADIYLAPNPTVAYSEQQNVDTIAATAQVATESGTGTTDAAAVKKEEPKIMTRRRSRGISLYGGDK